MMEHGFLGLDQHLAGDCARYGIKTFLFHLTKPQSLLIFMVRNCEDLLLNPGTLGRKTNVRLGQLGSQETPPYPKYSSQALAVNLNVFHNFILFSFVQSPLQ